MWVARVEQAAGLLPPGWLCGPCIRRCADRPARDVCAPGLSSLRPESRVCGHAFGVPVSGLMPGAHVALAAEPNAAVNVVARNALAAPDAQLAARTLVTALALCFVACAAPATVGLAARGGHQPLSTGLYTTLQTAVGTPLGHSRRYALISFHYFRRSIATVERREASVPRHKRVHARLDALWDARRLASAWPAASCAGPTGVPPSTRTSLGAPPTLDSGERSNDANPGRRHAPRERWRLLFWRGGTTSAGRPRESGDP
jgi:hypothetical protein